MGNWKNQLTQMFGRAGGIALLAVALVVAGCDVMQPQATQTPVVLIVTATPEPVTPTASSVPSPVLAPVAAVTRTPLFATATRTPLPTIPPTLTPSFTPTYTESPAPTGAAGFVPGPGGILPSNCLGAPAGGFGAIYARDPALASALGCAVSGPVAVNAAVQEFESGRMVWVSSVADVPGGAIYALLGSGAFQRYPDTWVEGVDPVTAPGGENPPPGRMAPIRGFGKVWGLNTPARSGLGWALAAEQGTPAQMQRFERGEMIYLPSVGQTLIVFGSAGQWRGGPTPF